MSLAANPDRHTLAASAPLVTVATLAADLTVGAVTVVPVSATTLPCRLVILSSLASNTQRVRWSIGQDPTANKGSPIEIGTTIEIPVGDALSVRLISESGSQTIAFQVVTE